MNKSPKNTLRNVGATVGAVGLTAAAGLGGPALSYVAYPKPSEGGPKSAGKAPNRVPTGADLQLVETDLGQVPSMSGDVPAIPTVLVRSVKKVAPGRLPGPRKDSTQDHLSASGGEETHQPIAGKGPTVGELPPGAEVAGPGFVTGGNPIDGDPNGPPAVIPAIPGTGNLLGQGGQISPDAPATPAPPVIGGPLPSF